MIVVELSDAKGTNLPRESLFVYTFTSTEKQNHSPFNFTRDKNIYYLTEFYIVHLVMLEIRINIYTHTAVAYTSTGTTF